MHPLLQAGIAAALFALTTPAQQGRAERQGPRGQQEHALTQPPRGDRGRQPSGKPTAKASSSTAEARPDAPTGQRQDGQPEGEAKPAGRTMTPEQRAEFARRFLEEHPELRRQLHDRADADGDGQLSDDERAQLKELIETHQQQRQQSAGQRGEGRDERGVNRRQDRREDRAEDRQDDRRDERAEARRDERTDDRRQDRREDRRDDRVDDRRQDRRGDRREERRDRRAGDDDGRSGPRDDTPPVDPASGDGTEAGTGERARSSPRTRGASGATPPPAPRERGSRESARGQQSAPARERERH